MPHRASRSVAFMMVSSSEGSPASRPFDDVTKPFKNDEVRLINHSKENEALRDRQLGKPAAGSSGKQPFRSPERRVHGCGEPQERLFEIADEGSN